ncbi:MAG TPA: zinc ribbon domain-containing protein [Armatimonadota bacterium]|nr:zinc ribbon domain-containing protein [Armatimonadota bacterium]
MSMGATGGTIFCPQCGTPQQPGTAFCGRCGCNMQGAAGAASAMPPPSDLRPHRGGTLMGLSIGLAVVDLFCCPLASIASWVMANGDIKEMDAGRMDPSGRQQAKTAMAISIGGLVLGLLCMGGGLLVTLMGGFAGAGAGMGSP